jgi:nitronate monooxygenase
MQSRFLRRLGIEHPVMLAPMAGGPSTPELAAAVSNAGGMGFLGAAYLPPEQLADAIRRTRELTRAPFGVNLFAGGYDPAMRADAGPMLAVLSDIHRELGLPPPTVPSLPPDPFPQQLEVVLDARPTAFSFTFGIPAAEQLARLKARGIAVLGTATTVSEARLLADAGVDAVVGQGAEAGGHRGAFAATVEAGMIPMLQLVKAIAQAVPLPVLAAGGIMDGRDLRAALEAGAAAAQLGTAFLACPESGTSEAYRRAVLSAGGDLTVLTRAFSGRAARGLANGFIARLAGKEDAILPFPLQNALTRPMRTAAAKMGDAQFLSLWAGQGVGRIRPLPAGELVKRLVEEMRG